MPYLAVESEFDKTWFAMFDISQYKILSTQFARIFPRLYSTSLFRESEAYCSAISLDAWSVMYFVLLASSPVIYPAAPARLGNWAE